MFPTENAADLSYVQLWLLHWVQVYDWAFSLQPNEKPNDNIIEDDDRFDEWYRVYTAQKLRDSRQSNAGRGSSSSSHDNVITF